MAFNPLEYLEEGNVDFIYKMTSYDYQHLIRYVRESERRISIVNGFLPKLRDNKPSFCFDIIYDMDEFKKDLKYLLDRYYGPKTFTKESLEDFLCKSSLGPAYLEEHFEEIILNFSDDLNWLFKCLFNNLNGYYELLRHLAFHSNLHIRYAFMKYLIEHESKHIDLFYDDITKYLTSETFQEFEQLSLFKDYMDMKEVSELAHLYFDQNIDYKTWEKFKNFILTHYEDNELAYRLLRPKKEQMTEHSYRIVTNKEGIEEFNRDADRLFETSTNYRVTILEKHSTKVSRVLLEVYKRKIRFFEREGHIDDKYRTVDIYGLSRKLDRYVDKYLSLSSDSTYEFLEEGSTASCYRIGDYVFKLVRTKWSYEQVICPNLYIILPNLEEDFVRTKDGIVLSGIEVQKYLSRSAKGIPLRIFTNFKDELTRLGYYTTDTLIGGNLGDNCRLLNHYTESGEKNPPEWFKEYPLVLIDRDRVYSIGNNYPKQLREGD